MDIPIPHVSMLPEQQTAPPAVPALPALAGPAPVEVANPSEVYSLWEARDEAQVVDALKGRFLAEFIYEYCRRHKWVDGRRPPDCHCSDVIVGLSWVGVQEAAREYKGIQVPVEKVKKTETEDTVEVMVEAIDGKTGSSRIGIACQNKKMRLRTGQVMDDEFCVAKAVAKAQRNAIRPLLPISLIKIWIEAHRTQLNGQKALPTVEPRLAITTEAVPTPKPNGNGNGSKPPAPALPPPAPPTNGETAPKGYPSSGQVKRIFGIAYGHKVAKEDVRALIERICGVHDPAAIPTRELYEKLCTELEKYQDGVPF